MRSLCETANNIKPSGIRKFFDVVSEMPDAISLGVGEPDFDTPWHVVDEGIYSLEKAKTYYTSNSGLMELRPRAINRLSPVLSGTVMITIRKVFFSACTKKRSLRTW